MSRRTFNALLAGVASRAALAQSENVRVIVSSSEGDRLHEKRPLQFGSLAPPDVRVISVDSSRRFQTIAGFGATFNEAGLMCLNALSPNDQEKVLKSLFELQSGAGFSLMKSPLAACDFAAAGAWYTYDDVVGDVDLNHFSIERDLRPNGLITYIRRARKYGSFLIQSTTDYPPDWMLDGRMNLQREHYAVFARYVLRYIEEYARQGIDIDYYSVFNEPQYIYCRIHYPQIRDLIKSHLGPAFRKAGVKTKIQISDSNSRSVGLDEFPHIMNDPDARRYIATMPVHGYEWDRDTSSPSDSCRRCIRTFPSGKPRCATSGRPRLAAVASRFRILKTETGGAA